MTSPAIGLFKDQLNQMLESIRVERGLQTTDHALPYWYLKTFHSLTFDDVDDVVTEGPNDLGIDAILISDDEESVTFFQFKNPQRVEKGVAGGDVDKVLSGLELILQRKHQKISNKALKGRIDEIHQRIRREYKVVFVSTGTGLPSEGAAKLEALCERWSTAGARILSYECIHVTRLQELYYNKTLPTLDKKIEMPAPPANDPYAVKIGNHKTFVIHLGGRILAKLYEDYGEGLLQQNIRTFEGETETNQAILRSCTTGEGGNFAHYNNGITVLCDDCAYDPFSKKLQLDRPQVVNGGQTIRILAKANESGNLHEDVYVIVRIITSDKDKEFAGNVAVNLNNQTVVKSAFLKSNHPEIIQLASTLLVKGYYLERREGELDTLSEEERKKIEAAVGSLADRSIQLQSACQAYIAFFDRNVDIAKKNPKKIFLSKAAGGYFEQFINFELSASKFLFAWELYKEAMRLSRRIASIKRKFESAAARAKHYKQEFPECADLIEKVSLEEMEGAAPPASLFVVAVLGAVHGASHPDKLNAQKDSIIGEMPRVLFELAARSKVERKGSTWGTLLKSQQFYAKFVKRYEAVRATTTRKRKPKGKEVKEEPLLF